jgi:DNA-binding transcriptional regulator GbsR (MarR family)
MATSNSKANTPHTPGESESDRTTANGPVNTSGLVRTTSDSLRNSQDRFISVWGQMGSSWGISRTMAEVHALLFITGESMCTDDVMERLDISRGNASMTLRALVEWGLIAREHKRGDRKEYYTAEQDVWTMFRAILRERLKREVDPLLISMYEIRDMTTKDAGASALKESSAQVGATKASSTKESNKPAKEAGKDAAKADRKALKAHHDRVDEMLAFLTTIERLSQRFVSPSGRGLQAAATLLAATMGSKPDGKPDSKP